MMVEVYVSVGLVGCRRKVVVEVEDDMTDEEIEEAATETLHSMIEWGWRKVDDAAKATP